MSTENLRYLSSEQALSDLANFRNAMAQQHGFQDNKWIAFGGSYPGNYHIGKALKSIKLKPLIANLRIKLDLSFISLNCKSWQLLYIPVSKFVNVCCGGHGLAEATCCATGLQVQSCSGRRVITYFVQHVPVVACPKSTRNRVK